MFCIAAIEALTLNKHTAEEVTKMELNIVFRAVRGVFGIPNPTDIVALR